MCDKEVVSRIEPLDRAVTNCYFRYARFPLLSARRLVEFGTCHLPFNYALFGLIFIAIYACKSPRICF